MFKFEIIHKSKCSNARVGRIHTPHGIIETPNFVPVGTNACIKGLDGVIAQAIGVQLMFANTYHLMVHPGADIIEQAGGIHKFANHCLPIITDSGGFQVFSLKYGGYTEEIKSNGKKISQGSVIKISEDGVKFRSYKDGSEIFLSPESSIQAQKKIGADFIVTFDELPPYHFTRNKLIDSLHRTHRWEERSIIEHLKDPRKQQMYAVVHGGVDKELRGLSIDFLSRLPFFGFGIGGSVGKDKAEMLEMLNFVVPRLPEDKPNHLLGIADLASLATCIPLGIDTFDSAYPSKCARHGLLFNQQEHVRIFKAKNAAVFKPIDTMCACYTCSNYTIAYLHHLFRAHELTAYTLATIHNIYYMLNKMQQYRTLILQDLI